MSKNALLNRMINDGVYQLTERQGKSDVWNNFADIMKEDGSLVDGYVCCKKCKKVSKHDGRQTTNIRRHKCFYISLEDTKEDEVEDCRSLPAVEFKNAIIHRKISVGVYQLKERYGKSDVWNKFADIMKEDGSLVDGYVCCKKCKKVMKHDGRQTTNIRRHKCFYNLAQETKEDEDGVINDSKQLFVEDCRSLSTCEIIEEDREGAIDACTQWIIEDCRPFSAVEGTGFAELAQFFINIGAKYGVNVDICDLIPDATTVSRNIHKVATEKKCEIQPTVKKVVEEGRASVTTDLWTDYNVKRIFLCATLHYFDKNNLTSIVLGVKSMDFERSTGAHIHDKLISIFSQFGVHNLKTLTFVTDSDSNILNALQDYTRINCSKHLFSNVVTSAFTSTNELKSVTDACKRLVKYLKKSNQQHALQTSLNTQCPTRWNSFYVMFKSIADNWLSIKKILTKNGQQNRYCEININVVNSLVELCHYFDTISNKLQGCSYITIWFVLPSIYRLKEVCEAIHSDDPAIVHFKCNILNYIETIWMKNLSIHHKVALFLYPPAKHMHESEHNVIKQFCIDHITANIKNNVAAIDSSTLPSNHSRLGVDHDLASLDAPSKHFKFFLPHLASELASENVTQEVDRYCGQRLHIGDDFDAMAWWKGQESIFPRLSKFAIKILSIPASCAASERVFSLAGNLINEKRNRSAPNTVDNILFLNSFLKINKIKN